MFHYCNQWLSRNQWFSDVFRGYRNATVMWNGLIKKQPAYKQPTLHKKWSFISIISLVNVIKFAVFWESVHFYWRNPSWKTSFLCSTSAEQHKFHASFSNENCLLYNFPNEVFVSRGIKMLLLYFISHYNGNGFETTTLSFRTDTNQSVCLQKISGSFVLIFLSRISFFLLFLLKYIMTLR